jgi:glutathione S-transferase
MTDTAQTLTLYGIARSRAMRNLWLLKEIGVPFQHVEVVQTYNKTAPEQTTSRDAAFLAINPNGRIPALKDGDLMLCESLAINLYLARKYGGPIGPANLAEEAHATMWSFWVLNECEANAIAVHEAGLQNLPEKAAAAIEKLEGPFGVLNAALDGKDYLVGGRFTVADVNVATILFYARTATDLLARFPVVARWYQAMTSRPHFQDVLKMREA